MPINFRDLTRSRKLAARRAADFGADRPFANSGDYWTRDQCAAMAAMLVSHGFRQDVQINILPLARSVPALSRDVYEIASKTLGDA